MASKTRRGDAIWLDVSTLRDPGGGAGCEYRPSLSRCDGAAPGRGCVTYSPDASERRTRSPTCGCGCTALTMREQEILELVRTGATTPAIASQLGITRATVRNHVQNIFGKLGVHSRLAAVTQCGAR